MVRNYNKVQAQQGRHNTIQKEWKMLYLKKGVEIRHKEKPQ